MISQSLYQTFAHIEKKFDPNCIVEQLFDLNTLTSTKPHQRKIIIYQNIVKHIIIMILKHYLKQKLE